MKILVLGGYGFIGSHICERLKNNGHEVIAYSRNKHIDLPGIDWFKGDFLDKGKLSEALVGIHTVVHCISTTVPLTSSKDPIYDAETNLLGTMHLTKLMQQSETKRLIYLSSGGTVYGNHQNSLINEDTPLNPVSSYGAIKVAIEKYLNVLQHSNILNCTIFRPSNPYGERQSKNGVQGLISTLIGNHLKGKPTTIFGDGSSIRDYIYVKDLADVVAKSVEKPDVNNTFNASYGEGFSINEIVNCINGMIDKPLDLNFQKSRQFDVKSVVLDSSLARNTFQWKPDTTLESGVYKQLKYMNDHFK